MRQAEPLVDLLLLEEDQASSRLFTTYCGQALKLGACCLPRSRVDALIETALTRVR